jgi:uncharacterized membrane protein
MNPDNVYLRSPATPRQLRYLASRGVLSAKALEQGLKLIGQIPSQSGWARFVELALLVFGAAFVVSGIFFFFAFNWAEMHRFLKLAMLEITVLLTVGLVFWQKLDQMPGKIALSAAALLVGALLGVYGQIYQTGADSYQLFFTWALLIGGWVLISKFTPLWCIWITLLNLSLVAYGAQINGFDGQFYLWIVLLNRIAIVGWEVAHQRGVGWLKSRWTVRLLAIPLFTALVIPALIMIFNSDSVINTDPWLAFVAVLFMIMSIRFLYIYSQKIPDACILSICLLSLMVVCNVWIANLFDFGTGTLFCLALVLIGQAGLAVIWLRHVSDRGEENIHETIIAPSSDPAGC